jgi:uncharacterized protein YgbK (DUF1537 family)
MVPGHAYRVDWADIRAHADQYSAWLWHTTAATHGLMQQMAQRAFCAGHHAVTQRLASWLLMCMGQYGDKSLTLPLAGLPAAIRQNANDVQNALRALENQGAIQLCGESIDRLDADRLAAVACRCHTMVKHTVVVPPLQPL